MENATQHIKKVYIAKKSLEARHCAMFSKVKIYLFTNRKSNNVICWCQQQ